jgi:hypothetical protein
VVSSPSTASTASCLLITDVSMVRSAFLGSSYGSETLGVQAFAVACLADRHRRRDVDEQEVAHLADHPAHLCPGRLVRGDRRADRDAAVPGDLGGHVTDPGDVQVAIGAGEGEPGRQELPDQVSVEQ